MFCKSCGIKIDDDSIFCSSCGTRQAVFSNPNIENQHSTQNFKKEQQLPKYDLSYKKESDATISGFVIIIVSVIFILIGPTKFEDQKSFNEFRLVTIIFTLVIRITATIWVANITKKQNRETIGWGFLAFFFPSITLIIVGQLRKIYSHQNESVNNKYDTDSNINIPTYKEAFPKTSFDLLLGKVDTIFINFSDGKSGKIFKGYSSNKFFFIHSIRGKQYFNNKESCIIKLYKHLLATSVSQK